MEEVIQCCSGPHQCNALVSAQGRTWLDQSTNACICSMLLPWFRKHQLVWNAMTVTQPVTSQDVECELAVTSQDLEC